jgi:hypothetical protein
LVKRDLEDQRMPFHPALTKTDTQDVMNSIIGPSKKDLTEEKFSRVSSIVNAKISSESEMGMPEPCPREHLQSF